MISTREAFDRDGFVRVDGVIAAPEVAALDRGGLREVELTGEPGDVVLMDPRCLHTTSANVSSRPRLTMRMTCVRR